MVKDRECHASKPSIDPSRTLALCEPPGLAQSGEIRRDLKGPHGRSRVRRLYEKPESEERVRLVWCYAGFNDAFESRIT